MAFIPSQYHTVNFYPHWRLGQRAKNANAYKSRSSYFYYMTHASDNDFKTMHIISWSRKAPAGRHDLAARHRDWALATVFRHDCLYSLCHWFYTQSAEHLGSIIRKERQWLAELSSFFPADAYYTKTRHLPWATPKTYADALQSMQERDIIDLRCHFIIASMKYFEVSRTKRWFSYLFDYSRDSPHWHAILRHRLPCPYSYNA